MKKFIILFYLVIALVLLNYWILYYDHSSTTFPLQNNTILLKKFKDLANALLQSKPGIVDTLSRLTVKKGIPAKNDLYNTSEVNCALGAHYYQHKKIKLSLIFYQKALAQKKMLNDQKGIAIVYNRLSELFANKSFISPENIQEMQFAMIYGLQAFQIADKLKVPYILNDATKNISLAYKKLKNTGQALRFFEINKPVTDSLLYNPANEALAFAEILWSNEKKQQQIVNLKALNRAILVQKIGETKRYKNIVFSLILILGLGAISVIMYWLYSYKRQEIIRQKELSRISLLRLQNIRNRISPHFIFNILNREISLEENKERYQGMIGLVTFLRRSLEIAEQISVTLEEELDFVKNYLGMEQKSLDKDFCVLWDIDSNINTGQLKIPAMIMQIPIENALKHALREKEGEKLLHISIEQDTKVVRITIQDNGDGYHPERLLNTKGTGTGLKVLYQTIQVLNERNNEKIAFNITDMKDEIISGTRVMISIPTSYNFEI